MKSTRFALPPIAPPCQYHFYLSREDDDANETLLQTRCPYQGKVAKIKQSNALAHSMPTAAQDQEDGARRTFAQLGEHDDTLWREQLAHTPGRAAVTDERERSMTMSTANGWGLTARLISRHFGVLGERVSKAIASFDPQTANDAERDRLASTLRETAQVLASARTAFARKNEEVIILRTLIANDENAPEKLAVRLAAGTISEATATLFCDELEANKARLPHELPEESDARACMDELQKLVDALSGQLAAFDAQASKTMLALIAAKPEQPSHVMHMARHSELAGMQGSSTALHALTRRTHAGGRLDRAARIDAIRRTVSQFQTAGESTLERLQRLSSGAA